MGEVYRALDRRFDRELVIMVLEPHFAEEEDRLPRFEREAKALVSLIHPNLAQLHGVDAIEDACILVLEQVPGETLEDRIALGSLARLFGAWTELVAQAGSERSELESPVIEVPELLLEDMFEHALRAIARDGAVSIELAARLQKALEALTLFDESGMRDAAKSCVRMATARVEAALERSVDHGLLRSAASFAQGGTRA